MLLRSIGNRGVQFYLFGVSSSGSENKPRRVVRSASEGYLNLIEPQKPKSIFYKTSQQLKRVAKRM